LKGNAMPEEKKIVSQEEIDKFKLADNLNDTEDIKNLIVLIKNELFTLEKQLDKFPEKNQKKIRKKLNKIMMEIIDIRKV
jgi:uncharacterized protein YpuA (DUF1002 family)